MWLAFLIKEALWLQAVGLPAGSNMDFVFNGAWVSICPRNWLSRNLCETTASWVMVPP